MQSHIVLLICFICFILLEPAFCVITPRSSVSQYGITWTFSQQRSTGQFANGDFWVLGPVTLTQISPPFVNAFGAQRNGTQINPINPNQQGLDNRISGFNLSLTAQNFPLLINYDASVITAVSRFCPGNGSVVVDDDDLINNSSCRPALQTAAILTVLMAIPPDDGADCFRPPYAGTVKNIFRVSELRTQLLPSLIPPTRNVPSLATVAANFQRPWLDWLTDWVVRFLHPLDNMPDYGSQMSILTNEATLRLMLNDSVSAKLPALINFLQYSVDLFGNIGIGTQYFPNGGHSIGRLLPLVFGEKLINSNGLFASRLLSYNLTLIHELSSVVKGRNGIALFGQPRTGGALQYWQRLVTRSGSRTIPDPHGYIDGGEIPGRTYDFCCNSMPFKGIVLSAQLMDLGLSSVQNFDTFVPFLTQRSVY